MQIELPVQLGVADGDLIQAQGSLRVGDLIVVKGNERIPFRSESSQPGDVGGGIRCQRDAFDAAKDQPWDSLISSSAIRPRCWSACCWSPCSAGWRLTRMPMQLTPEVQTPTITIETRWPGASPQEVEQEIIVEQEEQLKGVEGVTKMSSESTDSLGTDHARVPRRHRHGEGARQRQQPPAAGPEYPEDADQPVISTANATDRPIAWFILSPPIPDGRRVDGVCESSIPSWRRASSAVRSAHNPGLAMLRLRTLAEEHPEVNELLPPAELDVPKLRRFAEDEIEARFERVSGVSQSNVHRRPGRRTAGDHRSRTTGRPAADASPTSATCCAARTKTPRPATSGKANAAGSSGRWGSSARPSRSSSNCWRSATATRSTSATWPKCDWATRSRTASCAASANRASPSTAVRETGANVLDVMDGLQDVSAATERRHPEAARPAADAGLRRNRIHQLVGRPGPAEHLHRRRADDDRADAVPAPGRADADRRSR